MSKIDLLLHPIRLSIITTLAGKSLTPAQIWASIPNVPQATLYRHLSQLLEGGIIAVIEEHRVRGTIEKVYQLVDGASRISPQDVPDLSDDDHLNYFMVFLLSILQNFSTHLENRQSDKSKMDKVIYNKVVLYLTDEEQQSLTQQIRELIIPYITASDDEHHRHIFSLISIPED